MADPEGVRWVWTNPRLSLDSVNSVADPGEVCWVRAGEWKRRKREAETESEKLEMVVSNIGAMSLARDFCYAKTTFRGESLAII